MNLVEGVAIITNRYWLESALVLLALFYVEKEYLLQTFLKMAEGFCAI